MFCVVIDYWKWCKLRYIHHNHFYQKTTKVGSAKSSSQKQSGKPNKPSLSAKSKPLGATSQSGSSSTSTNKSYSAGRTTTKKQSSTPGTAATKPLQTSQSTSKVTGKKEITEIQERKNSGTKKKLKPSPPKVRTYKFYSFKFYFEDRWCLTWSLVITPIFPSVPMYFQHWIFWYHTKDLSEILFNGKAPYRQKSVIAIS